MRNYTLIYMALHLEDGTIGIEKRRNIIYISFLDLILGMN